MNKRLRIDEEQNYVNAGAKKKSSCEERIANSKCSCSTLKIEAVTSPVQHAEGPHWDEKNNALYYVDTFQATAYRLKLDATGKKEIRQKLDGRDSIGVIVPIKDTKDEFVIAADRHVYRLKWRTEDNKIISFRELKMVEAEKPKNQFNDGKADALGRLWIGTLTREKDMSVSPNGGCLYRLDVGKVVTTILENTSISNGIAWSSDNKKFFYIDSQTKKVMEYEFDLQGGNLGESRVLFDMEENPSLKGIPDGMTIDNNNNLWIALFGGHGIIHVDGKTGELIRFVKLPVTYCTSACFGGPSQDVLFVTTSRFKLSKEEAKKEEEAGSVFAIRNLGVSGPAPYECVIN